MENTPLSKPIPPEPPKSRIIRESSISMSVALLVLLGSTVFLFGLTIYKFVQSLNKF